MTVSLASRPHPTGQKPRWTVCLVAGAPGSRDSPGGRTPVNGCQYMIEWEGGLPEAPTFLGPWLRPHPTLGVSLMLAEMKWVSGGCKEPLLSCMKAHVPQWDPGVTSLRLSQSPTHCREGEAAPLMAQVWVPRGPCAARRLHLDPGWRWAPLPGRTGGAAQTTSSNWLGWTSAHRCRESSPGPLSRAVPTPPPRRPQGSQTPGPELSAGSSS